MLKFNEDAIKKDVEETLALRKDVEAAVKKICEKGYNNIFLVGIGGTYAVAEELMSTEVSCNVLPTSSYELL